MLVLIPETMRSFGREDPDIPLRLREERYIAQLTHLREGEVDAAVDPIRQQRPT